MFMHQHPAAKGRKGTEGSGAAEVNGSLANLARAEGTGSSGAIW